MIELITEKVEYDDNEYVNDLTREMDKHLIRDWKKALRKGYTDGTYIYEPFYRKDSMAIRFPGATRGHIEIDENYVITDIVLYNTATGEKECRCYKISVVDAVKKFIGAKIVIKEDKADESKSNG